MKEQEIVDYLKASQTCPALWPTEVREWAKRHLGEEIWQYQEGGIDDEVCWKDSSCGLDEDVHRLRSDFELPKETVGIGKASKSFDVSNGAMIMVTTNGGLIGFDSSQGEISPQDAMRVAQEILKQSFDTMFGIKNDSL